jgi:hypothetical protein
VTHYARLTFAMLISAPFCACAETLPPAGTNMGGRTAAATTANVQAPACEDGRTWQEALDALPPAALTQVEATYVWDTCVGTGQVTGVKLALPPDALESAPWAGLLACPSARVLFAKGHRSASGPSPAWTPDGWVEIVVERERETVVLTVSAETVPKNIRLFRRLTTFARETRE